MGVRTVTGLIRPEDMGVTTAHEHVFINLTAFFTEHPVPYIDDPATAEVRLDRLGILNRDPYALKDNLFYSDFETQKKELMYFKNAGGCTVVDATSRGIDRRPEDLKRMSEETGLNIIMGAGYYVYSTHPKGLLERPVGDVANEIIKELNEGVGDTGIRAGFIGEIGISELFHPSEEHVLRASAIASKETGAAIHVHINPWQTFGLKAAKILLDEGVSPDRICIDHVDVVSQEDYIIKLVDQGVSVEFDNFGKEYFVNQEVRNDGYGNFIRDTERVQIIRSLVEKGYGKQILLSNDVCLKTLLHTYGGWGYDHLLTNMIPMMLEGGVSMAAIDQMLVRNPAAFFNMKDK